MFHSKATNGPIMPSDCCFFHFRQNCFNEAAKLFRQVYNKPDYIPPSVGISVNNWAFVCQNYEEHKNIEVTGFINLSISSIE